MIHQKLNITFRPSRLINNFLSPTESLNIMVTNKHNLTQMILNYASQIPEIYEIKKMIDEDDDTNYFDNFRSCKINDHIKCKLYYIEKHIITLYKFLTRDKLNFFSQLRRSNCEYSHFI